MTESTTIVKVVILVEDGLTGSRMEAKTRHAQIAISKHEIMFR